MRKFVSWLIIFAVFSITAVNVLTAIGHFHPDVCQEGAQSEEKECSAPQVIIAFGAWINSKSAVIQALSAIAVAWFTFVLMKVGNRQADIASEQTIISKQQIKISETQGRAFVFGTLKILTGIKDQKVVSFVAEVTYENVGLTTATDVKQWIQAEKFVTIQNREPHFTFKENLGAATVLGPQTTMNSGAIYIPIDWMMECWENKADIYVWWRTQYRDILNPKVLHHHEQCVRLYCIGRPDSITTDSDPLLVRWTYYGPQNSAA